MASEGVDMRWEKSIHNPSGMTGYFESERFYPVVQRIKTNFATGSFCSFSGLELDYLQLSGSPLRSGRWQP
ncbi:hypothetical protein AERO8C_150072 [Aeromonas veronii]|uniref:Uncharacterized protein n=1 Tax=Aeromonas veronii TaxID=654 RepID=A0A653KXH3_AERVE|nr:hypothetical protein AERO8C_150072 [Aeromonas veronii]